MQGTVHYGNKSLKKVTLSNQVLETNKATKQPEKIKGMFIRRQKLQFQSLSIWSKMLKPTDINKELTCPHPI